MRPLVRALLMLSALAVSAAGQAVDEAVARAGTLRRQNHFAEAVSVLESVRSRSGKNATLDGMLGLCALDASDGARAQLIAGAWGQWDGNDYRLQVFLGRHAAIQGESATAATRLARALTLRERPVEARIELVRLELTRSRLGAAWGHAEALEALVPELGRHYAVVVLNAQAEWFLAKGAEGLAPAADKYVAAVGRAPEDPALREATLDTLLLLARVDEAREFIALFYGDDKDPLREHRWLAGCHQALKDGPAARREWLAVLALQRDHPLARLELARLDLEAGAWDAARAHLGAARADPDLAARHALVSGLVELDVGALELAEAHLRRARELAPDNVKTLYHLGRLLMRRGQREEGAALLRRYRELQR